MEIFKPIPYHPDILVNELGEFKGVRGRILKPYTHKNGYLTLGIWLRGKNKTKHFKVHRLVALTWIENQDNKPDVNHKNGIKSDNRVINLEWVTRSENNKHASATGLNPIKYGSLANSSKFDPIQIEVIRDTRIHGFSVKSISEYFKVHVCTIHRIVNNTTYGRT
ncbi:MAG: hypothetical protein BWY15_02116 [Firmicutes bacterium ADurb.Bin193]|nr:MAG: hypothetical protein BWY15_02116 [Firmicutes bacterium ADurb.Bin193]